MSKIRILDPTVANQIAAGEVVERPASVLKELLENSIDAGASRLRISLESGGKRSVRVEDDGEGMDRDDALLALERHATSKLGLSADLGAIRSLGFRGEALPSIASVSRFHLISRDADSEVGVKIEVEGGTIRHVEELGAPVGTVVEVRNLFYNLPARRKFLRTTQTELSHCLRVLEEIALARIDLRIDAEHAGRASLELSPAAERAERVRAVYGGEADDWIQARESRPGVELEIHASLKAGGKSRGRAFLFWVNGRPVQDRSLVHAVREAWGLHKGVERPGLTLVFLELPPEAVDVNIHPAKAEVRIREQGAVHDLVRDALGAALRGRLSFPSLPARGPAYPEREAQAGAAAYQARIGEALEAWRESAGAEPELGGVSDWSRRGGGHPGFRPRSAAAPQPAADEADAGGRPVPLVQYDESYIVAQDDEGLLIVDQHVAHERVLYEKFLAMLREGMPERQALLVPITLELPPHRAKLLEDRLEILADLGFEVEPFGGGSLVVKAAPVDLAGSRVEETLETILEDLEEGRDRDPRAETVAASLACQAAIKVNMPLTPVKMRWLLGEWWRCGCPMVCPHGRPVALRLSHLDLERAFLRR